MCAPPEADRPPSVACNPFFVKRNLRPEGIRTPAGKASGGGLEIGRGDVDSDWMVRHSFGWDTWRVT